MIISVLLLVNTAALNYQSSLFLLHLGFISTLYNVPARKNKSILPLPLRSIPILKIFLIAYVWSSISSFLPALLEQHQMLTRQNILIFVAHFLFIVSITLPFDIRDFKTDGKNYLITFPQIVGINTTKIIAICCLMGFAIIMKEYLNHSYLMVFFLITTGLIIKSSPERKYYYYLLYIDGTIILYFFLTFLSLR